MTGVKVFDEVAQWYVAGDGCGGVDERSREQFLTIKVAYRINAFM